MTRYAKETSVSAIKSRSEMPETCGRGHNLLDGCGFWVADKSRKYGRRWQCRECNRPKWERRNKAAKEQRAVARSARIAAWVRSISQTDLAWAAGHFEGEGTITLTRGKDARATYARPVASLTSTDREVINLFCAWWPCSIRKMKPRCVSENARDAYTWRINSGIRVRVFIDQIRPYIRTERCIAKFDLVSDFVDKILEPQTGKTKARYPEYITEIRRLNHRGRRPGEFMRPQIEEAYRIGKMPQLLIGGPK